MNHSREACEASLPSLRKNGNVVAMNVLAPGYLQVDQAVQYLGTLKNLSGAAVGASYARTMKVSPASQEPLIT
jgi:hypothetical protein